MEIIIGLIAYAVVLYFLVSFGRFSKECDNSMGEYFGKRNVRKSKKAIAQLS
ncbi:MAG: hypothetical protein M0R68_00255 [Bacteroidetes bacterium]|nr:hypothetical protein [Bacteroidota bacterium]